VVDARRRQSAQPDQRRFHGADERLEQLSAGGFGGVLFRAHEWANREQTLKSNELFARYVMPRFQGSLTAVRDSNEWARGNRKNIFSHNVEAVRRAFSVAGRAVPAEYRTRTVVARDVDEPTPGR
jgi:limonene 1,2-monooxygenase